MRWNGEMESVALQGKNRKRSVQTRDATAPHGACQP